MSALSEACPLVLVGAGKMGGALLQGWLTQGLDPDGIVIIDPAPPPEMAAFVAAHGLRSVAQVPADVTARTVVVAVKPQVTDAVLPTLVPLIGPDTVVVSVVAGKTMARFSELLGTGRIIRTIPNTPAQVGRGMTVAVAAPAVSQGQRQLVGELMAAVGLCRFVEDEALIDAVTAVSGSGPAYVFHMVEALAEAARAAGIDADLAMTLARATVEGAGELLHQSDLDAATLRRNVTSPAGTTAAALAVLMADDGLARLMTRAVAAATARSRELATGG